MKKIIFIYVLFIISCNNDNKSESAEINIEIENEIGKCLSMDSSNYSVNHEIFSLSMGNTEQIISEIDKIVAFEDNLYILSKGMRGNAGVFIFKRDGSFVKRLNKGKGRGEFIAPYDIIIDKKNKQLEVLDRMNCSILHYTLEGKFQSQSILPKLNYFEFVKLDNEEYLLFNSSHSFRKDSAYYFQRIKDGKVVEEHITKIKGVRNLLLGFHFFVNNNIYCNGTYGNIVYKFNKNTSSLFPYIKMNPILDKHNEALTNKNSSLDNEYSYFTNFRMFDNENLLSFNINKDKVYGIMYDIKSQKTYRHLFEGNPYFKLCIGADNNGEYFYIFPHSIEELKEYIPSSKKEKDIIDKIISITHGNILDSNPYIIYLSYDKK